MRDGIWARLLAATCAFLVGAGVAHAAEPCALESMIASYKTGLARKQAGDMAGARAAWRGPAERGFAPAQAELARLGADEGSAGDRREAALWAVLGARAEDSTAKEIARRIERAGDGTDFRDAATAANAWQPTPCSGDKKSAVKVSSALKSEIVPAVVERFKAALGAAHRISAAAALYFAPIEAYHIVPGGKYDRYVGWKSGARGGEMIVTVGNMLDESPEFFAKALFLEAAREVYARLPEARLDDPSRRVERGKRIVGSIYPDVDNESFFATVAEALKIAETLPPDIRRHVEIVDEIRYSPQSAHMIKGGLIDPDAGYYDRRLSTEGNRVIFIHRDIKWSFLADLLQTLVHEGTHATQHQRAEQAARTLPGYRAQLKALETAGRSDGQAVANLKHVIAEDEEYLHLWGRKGKGEGDLAASVRRIECEATEMEIRAARALDYDPAVIARSQYLKICDSLQRMMVEWKDRRLRENIERAGARPVR